MRDFKEGEAQESAPAKGALGEDLKPLENDLINAQSALTSQSLGAERDSLPQTKTLNDGAKREVIFSFVSLAKHLANAKYALTAHQNPTHHLNNQKICFLYLQAY